MRDMVCVGHGPGCTNVLHNFGPREVWEERTNRRRLRRVRIDPFYITQMLNPSSRQEPFGLIFEIVSNLPADANVVHVITDVNSPSLIAFVQSTEFEIVGIGEEVPILEVIYHRTERQAVADPR